MTLHFPGRAPSPIDPDRAPGAASLLEAIEQTGTPPPSPVAAAIIAEKALSEQSGVLSRIIPAPVLREAVEITRETVLGVGAATHMPDPDADRRALDGTLKELRSSYAAQEDTAGAQPTDLGDATSDNPLLRIGGTIGVVRELQRD